MFDYNRLEKSTNIETSGVFLENDYFKGVKKTEYNLLVNNQQQGTVDKKNMSPQQWAEMMMKNQQKALESPSTFQDKSYLKYNETMNFVERCQPFDPENPTPFFASQLYKKVLEILDLSEGEKLKFFTAVGSHLDYNHGVDAFFKLFNKHGQEISRATIDLSERDKRGKADLLLVVPDNEQDLYDPSSDKFDQKKFAERLEIEALKIKEILKNNNKYHLKRMN